ncbi:MAG TPA: neuraminidase-like domain-containing protein, partial [Gemmatimonadales bacterium]|nr:neuraminidase-like domain-containing protein [Gemmatimonadales bacterium]
KVVARSRQTTGPAEERRAAPQYRNGAAYDELGRAVYPWNLPFDLPTEVATVFLEHLGVSRRDLIEALRPQLEEFDPTSPVIVRLAAERLGLTDVERKIIVDEPLVPPREPEDFWDSAPVAALGTVQELLDRSDLSYAQLESLLATWFIDPDSSVAVLAKPGAPLDTCDTNQLQIVGLTADVLSRMHRFIRLWRKLGWTVAEVDMAIRTFTPAPDAPSLTNEILIRLDHLVAIRFELRMTVAQALALWEPVGTEEPHAIMARQLRLPVQDLLTALDLTGIDPFEARRSQDTLRFVEVVKAIGTSGFDFAALNYLIRHQFSPAASFVPTEQSLGQTLTEVHANLLKIDVQPDAEEKKLRESSIIDRVSAALSLPADVTGDLLGHVSHGNETALEVFLKLSAKAIDDEHPLSRANAAPQFETLERLLKIATILNTVKLPSSLLDWLFRENAWLATAHDQASTSTDFASWFSLIQLQQLRREHALEDAALEAIVGATSAVAVAADQPAREGFEDALSQWLGWAREDVKTLVGKPDDPADTGLLRARVPEAYRGLGLILNLRRAMGLLKRLGVTAARAREWCEAKVTDTNAKAIHSAAKAKHDDDAWPKIAAPLQDALRDKQREVLVSYLVARPDGWTPGLSKADANDLLSHFLIDVEMSSCQLTSRIKQAIGSVQLFAQRCLMGFEPDVQTNDGKWLQWEWMKNFRVWEANRKIWLYPENWIEPELRDGKTPFFKELENELLQTDLDDAAAEQALLHYLEKLDEVANLQIIGVYEDDEDKALHVFGRTLHAPHIYYYRRRDGATYSWTPWEKVELDIEGDHLIPVVWNRRLTLIWPIFTEKAKEKAVEMPGPGEKLQSADPYWEIQLAWSEYQHGRWSGKNLSEAVTFEAYQGDDNILFGERVSAPQNTGAFAFRPIGDGDLPDLPDNDGGGSEGTPSGSTSGSASTSPKRLVSKELVSFKALAFGDTLVVRGYLRRDYRAVPVAGDSQIACPFGEFRFSGCRKIVTTAHRNQMTGWNFALAPTGTKFDRMWFTQTGSGLVLFDGKFPVYPKFVRPETILSNINERAPIFGDPSDTLVNKLDIPVLDQTFSTFRLLAPHQDLQFVSDRPFFFTDDMRTFMATSTGASGKRVRPDFSDWVDANLATAWRADYFPPNP